MVEIMAAVMAVIGGNGDLCIGCHIFLFMQSSRGVWEGPMKWGAAWCCEGRSDEVGSCLVLRGKVR